MTSLIEPPAKYSVIHKYIQHNYTRIDRPCPYFNLLQLTYILQFKDKQEVYIS
jgi:hypothetical protein